jgi:hypothetical protein
MGPNKWRIVPGSKCSFRVKRKRRLKALLGRQDDGLQFIEHLEGDGVEIFKAACQLGLEGIVSKRADSAYKRQADPRCGSRPRTVTTPP